MKAAVVPIFVLLAGMLLVTPVAAARSGSPAWVCTGPSPRTITGANAFDVVTG